MLAHADQYNASAKCGRINAVLKCAGQAHRLDRHIEAVAAGQPIHLCLENLRRTIYNHIAYTVFPGKLQFPFGNIAHIHIRTEALGCQHRHIANRTGAHNQHLLPRFWHCSFNTMVTNTERLNRSKDFGRQAFTVVNALQWCREILAERAIALSSQSLVMHAGIYQSMLAGIAFPAVKIRVHCYNHSGFQAQIIVRYFHNFGCNFVSRDPRIACIRKCAAIGPQVAAADAAIKHFKQSFAFFRLRAFFLQNFHYMRFTNRDIFHFLSPFLLQC